MLDLTAFSITFIVFGIIGYNFSKKTSKQVTTLRIILVIIATILLYNVGNSTRIISIMGFEIMLNRVLGSLTFGYTLGILIKKHYEKKSSIVKSSQ